MTTRQSRIMVDQVARSEICDAIDDYLDDHLSGFAFDERLNAIGAKTQDHTAKFVIGQLWYVYDDCDDHLVCLDKESWDTIQRLKLVLQSGTEVQTTRYSVWHVSQLFAVACLAAIAFICSIDLKNLADSRPGRRPGFESLLHDGGFASTRLAKFPTLVHLAFLLTVGDCPGVRSSKELSKTTTSARGGPTPDSARVGRPCTLGFTFSTLGASFSPVPLLVQCLPVRITRTAHGQ